MKFEDALAAMRLGKKITHPHFDENIYFQACRVGFMFDDTPFEERPISIVKMLGDRQHPDMAGGGRDIVMKPPCIHGFRPQLELHLVMSDEWEVME